MITSIYNKDLVGRGILSTTTDVSFYRTWTDVTYGISKVVIHCESWDEANRWRGILRGTSCSCRPTLSILMISDGSAKLYVGIEEHFTSTGMTYGRIVDTVTSREVYDQVVSLVQGEIGLTSFAYPDVESLFQQHALPAMMAERLRVAHNLLALRSLYPPVADDRTLMISYTRANIAVYDDTSYLFSLSEMSCLTQDVSVPLGQFDHLIETCRELPTFQATP